MCSHSLPITTVSHNGRKTFYFEVAFSKGSFKIYSPASCCVCQPVDVMIKGKNWLLEFFFFFKETEPSALRNVADKSSKAELK